MKIIDINIDLIPQLYTEDNQKATVVEPRVDTEVSKNILSGKEQTN